MSTLPPPPGGDDPASGRPDPYAPAESPPDQPDRVDSGGAHQYGAPPPEYGAPPPPQYGAPPPPQYGAPPPPQYGAQPPPQYGAPPPPPYGAPPYGMPAGAAAGQPGPSNGLGTGALITGIVGLVFALFLGWFIIGIPLGILLGAVAIVLGLIGRGRAKRGVATNGGVALTGAVLGLIAVLVAIGIAVFYALVFNKTGFTSYTDCINNAHQDQAKLQKCADEFSRRLTGS